MPPATSRLGLLPKGSRHVLTPTDFLEGGKVDRQLWQQAWLGPQQEAVQRPGATKVRNRIPTDPVELRSEMNACKERMRGELRRTVPGQTILRSMTDAAYSLAEEIRKAGLSAKKRAEAERSRAPKVSDTRLLNEVLDELHTGDLVLMQSEAFTARFVTHAMRCEYSHLAIAVRLPKLDGTVFLLEADPEAHFVESMRETRWHLQLVDARSRLSCWLEGPTNYLAVRKLERPVSAGRGAPGQLLELLCPPVEQWDKPSRRKSTQAGYSSGGGVDINHMQALIEALYGLSFAADFADLNAMEGLDSMRSTEAVCLAYRALGAFDASFDVSSLTLSDFNLQPPFELGYSLGPPIGVAPMTKRANNGDWDRPSARIAELEQSL